jgi:transposase
MTKTAVEVITSVQRRRRWNAAEKERLVAASLEPGVGVSTIAREAGIHPSQLYGWRRQLCAGQRVPSGFAAVRIAPELVTAAELPATPGTIDVEFATGARMRITGAADPATLTAAIAALATNGRRR